MKKVAILTNFSDYLSSFSPLMLVESQIKMLTKGGYKPRVIVSDGFVPPSTSPFHLAELVYIPNITNRSDDSRQDPSFDGDIDTLAEYFKSHLEGFDVCITHDLLYLPDYTKYNIAARAVADELPEIRWLHWIHSCTSLGTLQRERHYFSDKYAQYAGRSFPNSWLVYPNTYDAPRIAHNLGFGESEVKVVPHPIDLAEFNKFEDITRRLADEKHIYEADVVCVYPLRMDRGKQPHFVMEIMAEVKRLGFSVRAIFVDFHSTGGDKVEYREEIKNNAAKLGMGADDVIFTSEFDPMLNTESPHGLVADLLSLSNVFILPSRSETYSLVAQEAMSKGNLVVLNQDFPPLYSVYLDHALYFKFSSEYDVMAHRHEASGKTETKYNPSQTAFCSDVAKRIIYELKNNRVLSGRTYVRQERNPDHVFKNYLEPLLHGK